MMKLLCCVSLCLATVSVYGLQADGASGVLPPNGDSSADGGLPNLFGGARLATYLRYGNKAHGINTDKADDDVMSYAGRTPYNFQALRSLELSPYISFPPASMPQSSCVGTASTLLSLFKDSLYRRGLSDTEASSLVTEVLQRLSSEMASSGQRHEDGTQRYPSTAVPPYTKRGYSGRGSFQMRFSPRFGTRLIPNQKNGDGGATLLRYGRSAEAVGASKE